MDAGHGKQCTNHFFTFADPFGGQTGGRNGEKCGFGLTGDTFAWKVELLKLCNFGKKNMNFGKIWIFEKHVILKKDTYVNFILRST